MKRGSMRRMGWLLAVGALAVLGAPDAGAAQQTREREQECRCVDAAGDPIEDCTCFRMPRFDMAFAPFAARPRLGISVSSDQGATFDAEGARVTSVIEDGPAYEAGLREGDVITRMDGQSLLQSLAADVEEGFDVDESLPVQRLMSIARGLEAGEEVEIEYLRDGQRRTTTVEAREISPRSFAYSIEPERMRMDAERMRFDAERLREELRGLREGMREFEFRFDDPEAGGDRDVTILRGRGAPFVFGPLGSARYGLELVELNEGLGAYFGTTDGVLVTDVDEDSQLGLRAGDVIQRVGDREAETPERVLSLLRTYDDDEEIRFRIRRDGREIDVAGRLGG